MYKPTSLNQCQPASVLHDIKTILFAAGDKSLSDQSARKLTSSLILLFPELPPVSAPPLCPLSETFWVYKRQMCIFFSFTTQRLLAYFCSQVLYNKIKFNVDREKKETPKAPAASKQMETRVPFVLYISKDGCCGFMTKQTEQGRSNSAVGIELLHENLKK